MALNIRERIRYFREHRLVQNFAVLQFGTLGNVVQAVIGIFFVRILKPELYGIYSLSFALAGLMSVVLGLGAQSAVTTILSETYARNDKEGTRQSLAFLVWSTIVLGSAAVVGALFAPLIARHFYGNQTIGSYAMIIIFASIISTLFFTFSNIALQVVGRYKAYTALGVLDQLTKSGLSLIFVLLGLGVFGAVFGNFVGASITLIVSLVLWSTIRRAHPIFPSLWSILRERKINVKRYFGFSFWVAVDRNLSNLFNILPVLLTGIYVAAAEVTYFKLAFGYLNLVLSFLGPIGTLLNVEFPKMKVDGSGRLSRNFVRVSLYSCAISLVITAGAVIISPVVFRILYGNLVTQSIPLVFGLFVYSALMGIGIGLGSMWRAINRVKTSIVIHMFVLGIGIPVGLWLIKTYGLWGSVIMVTLWYTVSHFTSFIYLARNLKKIDIKTTSV